MRALMIVSSLLVGCATTASDICEDIEHECGASIDVDACRRDGETVEAAVDASSCDAPYAHYLDCLEHDVCDWRRCEPFRLDVEACTGPFPNAQP